MVFVFIFECLGVFVITVELSQPISRVLSWTIIYLGRTSLCASSNLPKLSTGRAN